MVLKVSRRRKSSEIVFKAIRRERNGLEVTVLSAGQLQGLPPELWSLVVTLTKHMVIDLKWGEPAWLCLPPVRFTCIIAGTWGPPWGTHSCRCSHLVKQGVTWCKRLPGSLSSDCSEFRDPCCKPTHANKWRKITFASFRMLPVEKSYLSRSIFH